MIKSKLSSLNIILYLIKISAFKTLTAFIHTLWAISTGGKKIREFKKIKKYKAKISYGLLIFVFLIFFVPFIFALIKNEFYGEMIVIIGFLILLFAFILYLVFYTEYTIDNEHLKVKCGFFSYKPIKINEIKKISKTNNIISSPAPSFDRIEIKYGKFDEIIISPKDKFDFAKYLTKLNPNIINNVTER